MYIQTGDKLKGKWLTLLYYEGHSLFFLTVKVWVKLSPYRDKSGQVKKGLLCDYLYPTVKYFHPDENCNTWLLELVSPTASNQPSVFSSPIIFDMLIRPASPPHHVLWIKEKVQLCVKILQEQFLTYLNYCDSRPWLHAFIHTVYDLYGFFPFIFQASVAN